MGCDIHTNVEVRQPDGSWKSHQEWSQEDSYMSPKDELMDSRNYDLFAILADVRNGRGFAGIVTGQGFVPMATPRGVPDDASPEYKAWVEQWDGDGHSHSYFTVAEIMAYDWTQTSKKTGCVSLQEWSHYKVNGKLEQVEDAFKKSGLSIWDIYHDKDGACAKMEALLGVDPSAVAAFGSRVYTQVEWTIPYYHAGHELLGEVLPQLWRLGKPDDVRVVFFFDN